MNVSEYMKLFDALDEKDRLLVERLCEELVDLEKQMAEYKDLFPNMSDKEIIALYKQTIKK